MTADHPSHIGVYEVLGVIGGGAMGAVYRAKQPSSGRVVAIRVLPEEFSADLDRMERFQQSIEAGAGLSHPNIIQTVEKSSVDGKIFVVMEYVQGKSLAVTMKNRRLSLPETLSIFKQVCWGLEAAHRSELVHGDLQPNNILVSNDLRTVKIGDFGIGRADDMSHEQGTMSTSAVSLGTLHYMAPEQSASMGETDHRSDIYSVGVLLYEMLTGRVPVGRFNLPSQLNNDVPPDFDPIVLKCLETNASARYSSIGGIVADVGRLENKLRLGLASDFKGIKDSTSKIIVGSTRPFRRKKVAWAALGVVVVVAGAITTVILLRGQRGSSAPEVAVAEASSSPQGESASGDRSQMVAATEQYSDDDGTEDASSGDASSEDASSEGASTGSAGDGGAVAGTVATASPQERAGRSDNAAAEDLQVIAAKVEAGLFAPALADLGEFIDRNGDSPLIVGARLLEGQIYEKDGKPEQAKATYVEILSRHAGENGAAEAGYHLGSLFLSGGRAGLDDAREAFGQTAADYPRSSWAPLALAAKAKAERDAKLMVTDSELKARALAAIGTWKTLVENYPGHARSEQAWWSLGEEYEDLKEFELAAQAFQGLMGNFPDTRFEGWWRAGQIYDKKLDRKEEARLAYLQIAEGSRNYRDAQKRLGKL